MITEADRKAFFAAAAKPRGLRRAQADLYREPIARVAAELEAAGEAVTGDDDVRGKAHVTYLGAIWLAMQLEARRW